MPSGRRTPPKKRSMIQKDERRPARTVRSVAKTAGGIARNAVSPLGGAAKRAAERPALSSRRSMLARGPSRNSPRGRSLPQPDEKKVADARGGLHMGSGDVQRYGTNVLAPPPPPPRKRSKPRGGQQASRGAGTAGIHAHTMRAPTAGEIAKARTISTSRPAPPQPKRKKPAIELPSSR